MHLSNIIVEIFVVDRSNLFSLKIVDVDVVIWDIQNDNFLFIELGKEVDNVLVGVLIQDLALGIKMDDTLILSWFVHPHQDEGVVVGSGKTEYFRYFLLENEFVLVLK